MKRKYTAWAIVSPRGKMSGVGKTQYSAWLDSHWPEAATLAWEGAINWMKKHGYKAVKFSFSL